MGSRQSVLKGKAQPSRALSEPFVWLKHEGCPAPESSCCISCHEDEESYGYEMPHWRREHIRFHGCCNAKSFMEELSEEQFYQWAKTHAADIFVA